MKRIVALGFLACLVAAGLVVANDPLGGLGGLPGGGAGGGAGAGAGLISPADRIGVRVSGAAGGAAGTVAGPNFNSVDVGVGTGAGAGINAGGIGVSGELDADASMRARLRRTQRPRNDAPAQPQPSRQDSAAAVSQSNRAMMRADLFLSQRLSEIDRLRDYAVANGDIDLLTRADALELDLRAQHRQWIQAAGGNEAVSTSAGASGTASGQFSAPAPADFQAGYGAATGVAGNVQHSGTSTAAQVRNGFGTAVDMSADAAARAQHQLNNQAQFGAGVAADAAHQGQYQFGNAYHTGAEFGADVAARARQQGEFAAGNAVRQTQYLNGQFQSDLHSGGGAAFQARQQAGALTEQYGQVDAAGNAAAYSAGFAAGRAAATGQFTQQPGLDLETDTAAAGQFRTQAPPATIQAQGQSQGRAAAALNSPAPPPADGGADDTSAPQTGDAGSTE